MKRLVLLLTLWAAVAWAQTSDLDPNAALTKVTIEFDTPPDLDNSQIDGVVSISMDEPSWAVVTTTPIVVKPGKLSLGFSRFPF